MTSTLTAPPRTGTYPPLLDYFTDLLAVRRVSVSARLDGTIMITGYGETIEQMREHADCAAMVLRRNGFDLTRDAAHVLTLTPAQQATGPRLAPGTPVYDVLGDPRDPADTGTIFSIQDGGYGVLWTGDVTPKFAATDEVALLSKDL